MPPGSLAPEVIIWTDAASAATWGSLLDLMGNDVRPIGVGGPRALEVDHLARQLDCPSEDDLRKLVVDRPAAFLLLGTMEDVSPADLLAAAAQGTTILAAEPIAADLAELGAYGRASRGEAGKPLRALFVPAFHQAPGYLQSAEPHEVLGEYRLVAIEHCGPPAAGTLLARLYDAWRTVLAYVPLPEGIDASFAGPLGEVPESLRNVRGRIGAHARVADGSSVVLFASDQAAEARRWLHVLADHAELRVSEISYDLRQLDGQTIDRGEPAKSMSYIDLIARQWRRLIDRPGLTIDELPPHREVEAVACCMACLLSARTGQAESPRKLIEMNR